MGHVRGTWVAHYAAPAISCNQNENMLLLVAGDIGYPKVTLIYIEMTAMTAAFAV